MSPSVPKSIALLILLLVGCARDPLSSEQHIAGWANSSSALGVFTHGYEPLAFTDGQLAFKDPACPRTSDEGKLVSIVGACTDSEGTAWIGSATVRREGSGRRVRFESYGKGDPQSRIPSLSGDFVVSFESADRFVFTADLHQRGGVDTDILYTGRVEGGYEGPTLWNGQGRVTRDSLALYSGTVEATTIDQLRDNDICSGEGISGSTMLVSSEHSVEILYDGATDCDEEWSAHWTLDGTPQGVLPGVSCAMSAGSPASPPWLVFLLGLGVLFRLRRR